MYIAQSFEPPEEKEMAFFLLAERLRAETDAKEVKRLGDEMGRFIFGE